ncbi:DJ-1 family glyoxalase III [Plebeiibacterium marinum]|uniref:DJ-1/PfpI family protein n=1 Tax=Plebeiibacterium marinum TaxID=2992111 RepID=A0AAE3MC46_9BACT|nr:DJ-1 family glyoxalase III [Plebeiobacterium marinum]MCW3804822.1 DJ-1/PfpI family protein [Plebeiobacterium marinum]
MTKRVYIFLADGFEEIEAITPIDVLRRAGIDVVTISITDSLTVTGAHQIMVMADKTFCGTDFSDADMLVLPGGLPGTTNLNNHKGLINLLLDASAKGKLIGAICAAPSILGQQNLLAQKNATCYPGFEDKLTDANYTGKDVEVANNLITGKGAGVSMKFALQLVELLKGKETAAELAKKMMI